MSRLVTALVLFLFWLLLSGHFDPLHLFLGVICSIGVALLSHDLLIGAQPLGTLFGRLYRLLRYLPWLVYKVAVANIDVAYRVLHPKMPIDPELVTLPRRLESEFGETTLANSITLTPGTVTVDVDQGHFLVHALTKGAADDLEAIQTRVRRVEQPG